MNQDVLDVMMYFFDAGYNYDDIRQMLNAICGKSISYRHLKRVLNKNNKFRKKHFSDVLDVAIFIENEMHLSANNHGYRWFHQRAVQRGFIVSRETIRKLLQLLDPDGVKCRKGHRLRRRLYQNRHVDGYDKLKPYGICIHGSIDGFSRKIIWLHAHHTNNNPRVVAQYFMDAINDIRGCPERIRCDLGTENSIIKDIQMSLRRNGVDGFAGERSFLYGKSTANQRIESWWGQLKRHGMCFWIDWFKTLEEGGDFTGSWIDKNLIQFCFMNSVQTDLDDIMFTWNHHRIRKSRNSAHVPCGKPFHMYTYPEYYGGDDFCKDFSEQDLEEWAEIGLPKYYPCDEDVNTYCCIIISEMQLHLPEDVLTATDLYKELREYIQQDLIVE